MNSSSTPDDGSKTLDQQIIGKSLGEASDTEFADTSQWMQRTYSKLHSIAASQMGREQAGHTLSATSLVHEVFLRLRDREASTWISERQFLGIVAAEMKRVLIDAAGAKKVPNAAVDELSSRSKNLKCLTRSLSRCLN